MQQLRDKRIIVTGGAGGIGNAAVHLFAAAGARVATTYHEQIPELPAGVVATRCDMSDRNEVSRVFDELANALGGLDALVHAAGRHASKPAHLVTDEDWDDLLDNNIRATAWANQAAFQHLCKHGGSIVNMGSVEGVRGFPGNAVYAASRGAVMSWSRSIALEWGRHGIRVNCVAPAIHTGIFDRQLAELDPESRAALDARLAAMIPLGGRMGDATQDLAPVLAFLVGDESRFITGQVLAVDGGLMMLGS